MGQRAGRSSLGHSVGVSIVTGFVAAALVLLPALQRPAWAQTAAPAYPPAGSAPPPAPPPQYAPAPYYAPPPFNPGAATAQGIADAEADVNGTLWFFVGCIGVLGILIAYIAEPTPPPARLMGKSPEYLAVYTGAYKSAGKSAQGRQAIYGCLVGTGVFVAIYAIIFFVVISEASSMNSTSF